MASTKASGANIPEADRNTVAVKLRLDPETAQDLRDLAAECGCTLSEAVDAAMTALFRAKADLAHRKGSDVYAAFIDQIEGE